MDGMASIYLYPRRSRGTPILFSEASESGAIARCRSWDQCWLLVEIGGGGLSVGATLDPEMRLNKTLASAVVHVPLLDRYHVYVQNLDISSTYQHFCKPFCTLSSKTDFS